MKNFAILLRGQSLKKLDLIINRFDNCFIVNDFKVELSFCEKLIKGKHITHFVNSQKSASLYKKDYIRLNIKNIQFAFTKKHLENKHWKKKIRGIEKYYISIGFKPSYIPNKYYEEILRIRNTGVTSILYVSEIIKPKNIWLIGLDFYYSNYMIKKNSSHHLNKSKDIDLYGSFIKIVKIHPNIQYHILSSYKKFPKLPNLNIIKH